MRVLSQLAADSEREAIMKQIPTDWKFTGILIVLLVVAWGCSKRADSPNRPIVGESENCINCHENAAILQAAAEPDTLSDEPSGESCGGEVSPLEAWEKVAIQGPAGDEFMASVHGAIGCVACHGGTSSTAKNEAHEGVVRDPSENPVESCGNAECHQDIVINAQTSIHYTLSGVKYKIGERAGCPVDSDEGLSAGYSATCYKCHATCGQCHVSRPTSVDGGFVAGHKFNKTPSMINQCTACHGSRIGEEYQGKHHDEIPSYACDVHYDKNTELGGKYCVNCHTAQEMHNGTGEERFAVNEMPRCENCHVAASSANLYHMVHWGGLSCSVCHSQNYKNCDSCHSPSGLATPSYLTFKIGQNPLPEQRDYKYVTLRHAPVTRTSYSEWGYSGNLPQFDVKPTWKYTTPHNIQRWTARTDTTGGRVCLNGVCHTSSPESTDGFFLRQIDLDLLPDEAEANASCVVPDTPPEMW